MGILTNALNQLTTSVIGLGVDQLDDWFTRMAERGLAKEAAMALDNHIAQQHDPYMNQATGQQALQNPMGGGVLPVVNGQPTDFGNVQPIQPQSQLNMPQYSENYKAFLNPYTGQVMTYLANQEIQNDPRVAAAELARKRQEAIISASGSAAGTLGGKGNIGNYDIGPYITGTQSYSPQTIWGNAAQGQAQVESAKFPEWQKRHDISVADQIKVKQTPGARAMGSGDGGGGGPQDTILSSVTNEDLSRMEKVLMNNSQFATTVSMGYGKAPKKSLNQQGYDVLNLASDKLARQKKKNPMLAIRDAMREYKAQTDKDAGSFKDFANPTALQNLPARQPTNAPKTTPLPTALPNIPPPPTGPSRPAPSNPTTAIQGIIDEETKRQARELIEKHGNTPEVQKWLFDRGIDPSKL